MKKDREDITEDPVFEMELLRHIEVDIDRTDVCEEIQRQQLHGEECPHECGEDYRFKHPATQQIMQLIPRCMHLRTTDIGQEFGNSVTASTRQSNHRKADRSR